MRILRSRRRRRRRGRRNVCHRAGELKVHRRVVDFESVKPARARFGGVSRSAKGSPNLIRGRDIDQRHRPTETLRILMCLPYGRSGGCLPFTQPRAGRFYRHRGVSVMSAINERVEPTPLVSLVLGVSLRDHSLCDALAYFNVELPFRPRRSTLVLSTIPTSASEGRKRQINVDPAIVRDGERWNNFCNAHPWISDSSRVSFSGLRRVKTARDFFVSLAVRKESEAEREREREGGKGREA
jgi:hypothetical protein